MHIAHNVKTSCGCHVDSITSTNVRKMCYFYYAFLDILVTSFFSVVENAFLTPTWRPISDRLVNDLQQWGHWNSLFSICAIFLCVLSFSLESKAMQNSSSSISLSKKLKFSFTPESPTKSSFHSLDSSEKCPATHEALPKEPSDATLVESSKMQQRKPLELDPCSKCCASMTSQDFSIAFSK